MFLKELSSLTKGIYIVQDGEFDHLGLLATNSGGKMLSFIEKEDYISNYQSNDSISCIIIKNDFLHKINKEDLGIIISDNPRELFFSIHHALLMNTDFYGKKKDNQIASSAKIHPSANIAKKNVIIGEHVEIGPNVVIGENVEIANNVIVGPNTVIGGCGFECFRAGDSIINVKHAGGVFIGHDVSIHSNVCIDKGLFKNLTIVEEFCSIDNFVHIAHNVKIGKRTRIAAMAMIAGRTIIGDDVWIGPNVLITNGITIGNRCNLLLGSIVTKSVQDEKTVLWKIAY
jgi:UDP-3-O-[3-hydroxymyristoyl] glucosamine N-acyltransferase